MYAWIWRHLPLGLPGKVTGSVLLAGAAAALLWFVVFPWADPWIEETLLPWNEGQLVGDFDPGEAPAGGGGPPADAPGVIEGEDGELLPDDPHEIPYDTDE